MYARIRGHEWHVQATAEVSFGDLDDEGVLVHGGEAQLGRREGRSLAGSLTSAKLTRLRTKLWETPEGSCCNM